MSREIVIIGSGFAAQQLVKTLRKRDASLPIRLVTADSGDEYNKPDLSHVVSKGVSAASLTRLRGDDFAEQQRLVLHPHCRAEGIDLEARRLFTSQGEFDYGQLVLATGARALRPDVPGSELLVTLNSQQEYARIEGPLRAARRIMVLGAGLIGCELAMDLASAGRKVTLVDLAESPLSGLMPAAVSQPLQAVLRRQGVRLQLGCRLAALEPEANGVRATLDDGQQSPQDLVIAAIGLQPEVALARSAGLSVGRGIQVDDYLRTSDPHVYALGDNMELQGRLLPFLQPMVLGANALAATLLGHPTRLVLPPMLIKVKTPLYPLQLAGRTQGAGLHWQSEWDGGGMEARAFDETGRLCGFVVGGERMPLAFSLLRELPRVP